MRHYYNFKRRSGLLIPVSRRNKVIKEYKNIKDFYSWSDEDDNEMVDTEPIKNNISPKIYDQRTPLKKSKGMYNTEIVLSSDFSNKTEGISKSNRTITTSSFHTSFMIQQTCI